MESTNFLNNLMMGGPSDHYNPSVRLLQIKKTEHDGSCGFHLSRSRWDPYPWVSAVDETTPAEVTGLKVGDCVLEVNGEDILGLRISDIAHLVKARTDCVTLLLWSTGNDPSCDPDSLCCGPMPLSLERLSASMQTILASLECPVCMDVIPPPVLQCQNGHILCVKCRARSEKCPICRQRYSIVRSLIAEQIYSSIIAAFKLHDDINNRTPADRKLREKLFGAKYKNKKQQQQQQIVFDGNCGGGSHQQHTTVSNNNSGNNCLTKSGGGLQTPTNKFLARILGKACSMDSLSTVKNSNKDTGCLDIENMTKAKHFSLSTNDLSKPDSLVAIPRCPSVNRILVDVVDEVGVERSCGISRGGDNSSTISGGITINSIGSLTLNGLALKKRPSSLNASIEYVDFEMPRILLPGRKDDVNDDDDDVQDDFEIFRCPLNCTKKFKDNQLEHHVRVDHNIPIVSFGTSSAEISLPPRAPIENAVLILTLDNKQFWLKLTIDKTDDSIFTMALLQGTLDESSMYMLEARLRNRVENKLLEKELITRSIVYSLMATSWNDSSCISSSKNPFCSCYRNNATTTTSCSGSSSNDDEATNTISTHLNNNTMPDETIVVDINQKRFDRQHGIFYNQNNIRSTFNDGSELLLKIDVKHIHHSNNQNHYEQQQSG